MKKIYIIILGLCLFSCEKFLDSKDYLNKNDENFPLDERDIDQGLAAAYFVIASSQEQSAYFVADMTSDDRLAGGGPNDFSFHAWDQMRKSNSNMFSGIWNQFYSGIFRVNKLIENFDNVTFTNEGNKNQALGELYFLRGYFYFELSKMFGSVPLLISSEKVNIPQTEPQKIFGQICLDLKNAISMMSPTKYSDIPKERIGHATKWAAEGLISRAFLFYTGYYDKETVALADGSTLSKQDVISYLNDCINNSGLSLNSDFRNNWPYTNLKTGNDYKYNRGRNLNWATDGNNAETVFAIKFGTTGSWSNLAASNMVSCNYSLRGQSSYANVFPFGAGWGAGTVNPKFYDDWKIIEPNDTIRRTGSIINVDDAQEGLLKYEDGGWQQMDDSHLWQKKYIAINAWADNTKTKFVNYSVLLYGGTDDPYVVSTQDQVIIRYSDILLMHSELSETVDGINRVRARVKLPPISSYSLKNLQNERRFELAFEGLRYYDLLRWYKKSAGAIIDNNQNGGHVLNNQTPSIINYNLTDRLSATGGFFPIPQDQIDLSNNVLKQNEGWDASESQL